MSMRAPALCIVSLLLPLLASAQQKPSIPPIGETIEVSLVNLDVFVTDKAGNRVNPPSPGFPLHVDVGRGRPRGKEFTVPLTIHVPIAALTQLPDGGKFAGAFSVFFAWGGRLGALATHVARDPELHDSR